MTNACALDHVNVFASLECNLSRQGACHGNESSMQLRLFLSWSYVQTDIIQVGSSWLSLEPHGFTAGDDKQCMSPIDIRQ